MLKLSHKWINLISIAGTGTILGACIVIVLPESASILIQAQHELEKISGHTHVEHDAETHVHGPLSLGEPAEALVSPSTSNTIGAAIMCGFMLMLLIDEGVCMLRCYLKEKRL